jgi:GWxTD domain-containing protein
MLNTLLVATSIMGSALAGTAIAQVSDTVEVKCAKFYLADGRTLIDGFVKIPFAMLTPFRSPTGANQAVYRVTLGVTDETGFEMTTSDWTGSVPQGLLSTDGAFTVEHFSFAVPEGTYSAQVSVADSATGRVVLQPVTFTGYDRSPFVSDLVLTNALRRSVGEGDEPAPGEISKGVFFLSGTTRPILSPTDANLFYYVELYPGNQVTLTTVARVVTATGDVLVSTPASELNVGERGGVAARQLNLTGLPPGDYRLQLEVSNPDTVFVRSAMFTVGEFRMTAAEPPGQNDPFAFQNEQGLDTLYAPLIYLMEADERGIYEDLSVDGKRNYLRQFWETRDPTAGTAANEYMTTYYRGIAEANRRFGEGGAAGIPGWRTDRGRVFLNRGEPDEFLDDPGSGLTNPYIVWKFTGSGRPLKFVFLDNSGLGHYELVYTDDRTEQGRADWQSLFESQALERVMRF